MQDGFVYSFSILVFIFVTLFLNLLVAKVCDRRRRQSAQPLQPAQAAPRSIQLVVHVDAKSPPVLHMPLIYEAVCITHPDGKTVYAAPSVSDARNLFRVDTAFMQPWPQERPSPACLRSPS